MSNIYEILKKVTPGPVRWVGTKGQPNNKAYLQNLEREQVLVGL